MVEVAGKNRAAELSKPVEGVASRAVKLLFTEPGRFDGLLSFSSLTIKVESPMRVEKLVDVARMTEVSNFVDVARMVEVDRLIDVHTLVNVSVHTLVIWNTE